MRYLCLLIGEPETEAPVPGTPEFMQMLSDYESATRTMAADGVPVDSGPPQPPSAAATLRRAKRKIRDAGIPFRVPADEELPGRIGGVLRVVYLVFTEGHQASTGPRVVRGELCDEAVRLARLLAGLCPDDPEALGLLPLLGRA
jgi:hypothetical protein